MQITPVFVICLFIYSLGESHKTLLNAQRLCIHQINQPWQVIGPGVLLITFLLKQCFLKSKRPQALLVECAFSEQIVCRSGGWRTGGKRRDRADGIETHSTLIKAATPEMP